MKSGIVGKETGWKYLLFALGAFAALALEAVLVYGWEPIAYGGISVRDYSTGQIVLHWALTCITWSCAGWFLVSAAKKKLDFDIFVKSEKMRPWQFAVVLLGIALSVTISYFEWEGFKVVKEFEHNGAVKFIFQYIYYMVETVLFLLIIVFGQKTVEIWTKKKNVPWGGIICGLTWGISHLVSRGFFDLANGISSAMAGFLFGGAYLLTNRDIRKAWIILFVMFVI